MEFLKKYYSYILAIVSLILIGVVCVGGLLFMNQYNTKYDSKEYTKLTSFLVDKTNYGINEEFYKKLSPKKELYFFKPEITDIEKVGDSYEETENNKFKIPLKNNSNQYVMVKVEVPTFNTDAQFSKKYAYGFLYPESYGAATLRIRERGTWNIGMEHNIKVVEVKALNLDDIIDAYKEKNNGWI